MTLTIFWLLCALFWFAFVAVEEEKRNFHDHF